MTIRAIKLAPRVLGTVLALGLAGGGLAGCVYYPSGYAYAPGYYSAPTYVAPPPVVIGGWWGWGWHSEGHWRH
ncbi:MAG: hypothetical protein B7X08_05505 [Acidocella sp. 20-63-7]|nr:MAG: hypothetical protein B7X08_05505 [Acidocella sp. 20-63-7]HQT46867.1 hypothetical protein [Acidocella sp.]